ncbi:PA2169 family four-helix-bundle protein [Mycetohabitans sp. B46]|uniref:PA2169 family four-helix-bundle protein n=1 Tax=Mycetohabitans sp. B46 TaxID=2772536 RepID=UPI00307F7424
MATHIVSVLNNLIETSKDGEAGFRKAAEDASNPELKALFTSRAQSCAQAVSELQAAVHSIGGKAEDHGSASGALHRGWMDLKSAIKGRSDHEILADCEKGEDVAKKHYRQALDEALPADIRMLVERQYEGVLKTHDRVRELRDATAR